jgi:oligoribonuclease
VLTGRCRCEVEAGVEAASCLTFRGDPVSDPCELFDRRYERVLGTEIQQVDRAVVHTMSGGERRMAVGHRGAVGVMGQQHACLLETLADRGQTVRTLEIVAVVGLHLAPGEHVHPAAERRGEGAAQHEHLDPGASVVAIPHEHHRGGELDGNGRWGVGCTHRAVVLPLVLVWMDLEMTGLEPSKHVIVEIATLITDDELNVVAEGPDLVVHQSEDALALMEQIVVDMHTKSGLLDAIRASTVSLDDAGAQTLEFIKQWVPEARKVPLCGNSIGMDRRFLDAYLPDIENWLHYRSIDVSSVKELVRRWYPGLTNGRPYKVGTHRALDDIRESVAELKFYRERVFVPSTSPAAVAAAAASAAEVAAATPTSEPDQPVS